MSKKKIVILIIIAVILLLVVFLFVKNYKNYIDCAGAGEQISTMMLDGKECCVGLKRIGVMGESGEGVVWKMTDVAICSDCGNGFCESWENKHSCSEDCK